MITQDSVFFAKMLKIPSKYRPDGEMSAEETKPVKEKEGILAANACQPGDMVSTDQFVCKTPGRLPTGYGREGAANRYHGGTIFNDAASGVIWVENQVSLGAGETIQSKTRFEEWLWELAFVEVKHY